MTAKEKHYGACNEILFGLGRGPSGNFYQGGGGEAHAPVRRGAHRGRRRPHETDKVNVATKAVGISRSAFYKYRDAVRPFNDMKTGRIITFYTMLKNNPGVLSDVLSIFAGSGANILTINQSIPTNGCAAVTISAETSEMQESIEEMMARALALDGVVRFDILAA